MPGDYVEYTIGDESVLVVRATDGTIRAFHNSCLHRGTRLAAGAGTFTDGCIQCPYHGWQYALDGAFVRVVDAEEFTNLPDGLALRSVRSTASAASCSSTSIDEAEPLLDFLDPLPTVARAVPPRTHAAALIPHDDHRRELEGGRRRVQRGLSRARVCTRRSFRGPTT